jgi:hypothetical protein
MRGSLPSTNENLNHILFETILFYCKMPESMINIPLEGLKARRLFFTIFYVDVNNKFVLIVLVRFFVNILDLPQYLQPTRTHLLYVCYPPVLFFAT